MIIICGPASIKYALLGRAEPYAQAKLIHKPAAFKLKRKILEACRQLCDRLKGKRFYEVVAGKGIRHADKKVFTKLHIV